MKTVSVEIAVPIRFLLDEEQNCFLLLCQLTDSLTREMQKVQYGAQLYPAV